LSIGALSTKREKERERERERETEEQVASTDGSRGVRDFYIAVIALVPTRHLETPSALPKVPLGPK
jgi:hypothetical protein